MNLETKPYMPSADASPPALVGREHEIHEFGVVLARLGAGIHARSVLLDGFRGVGTTVLLRESSHVAREAAGSSVPRRDAPQPSCRSCPGAPRPGASAESLVLASDIQGEDR
jgi:Cdc6-like AAA superfamily ATPase